MVCVCDIYIGNHGVFIYIKHIVKHAENQNDTAEIFLECKTRFLINFDLLFFLLPLMLERNWVQELGIVCLSVAELSKIVTEQDHFGTEEKR